ncbi:MAG TPA: globin [Pirellulales bacterium]|nr:globin [Pirellulales bacterium]
MTRPDPALFNDSLERCTASPRFLDRFYQLFMASSAEVADKFQHTDFATQKAALRVSLYIMMLAPYEGDEARANLQRLATRHSRKQLDIKPELYDLWLDCLIQAAKEFDPLFHGDTEMAWRVAMKEGIEFMRANY